MDTLDGKGVNENVGDGFNDIEKRQMDSGATEKYDNFDGHDYGADGSKGDCDENSHGGDYIVMMVVLVVMMRMVMRLVRMVMKLVRILMVVRLVMMVMMIIMVIMMVMIVMMMI